MEKIVTAVLAVCAIMAVLSTVVTVGQEAVHKAFQSRRKGMLRLMEQLYLHSFAPRLRNDNLLPKVGEKDALSAAQRFALDMTANETMPQKGAWKTASESAVLRLYFGGRLESMTTRQFVEQLARSNLGWLIKHKDDAALAATLHQFAYDFDRFGEKQSAMFARRAKAMAVALGIALALALNVDVLHVFRTFMNDSALASRVIDASNEALQAQQQRQAAEDGAAPAPDAPPAQAAVADESGDANGQAALQQTTAQLASAVQGLRSEVQALRGTASTYEEFGLPVGARVFPFCNPPVAAGAAAAAQPVSLDVRCGQGGPAGVGLLAPMRDRSAIARFAGQNDAACHISLFGMCYNGDQLARLWARIRSDDGLIWLISVLAAGGGFGLGAPFWFNVARKIGGSTPAGKAAQLGSLDAPQAQGFMPAVRGGQPLTGPDLVHAFRTVASVNG
ncbi:MAG: hypothetical protein AB7M12_08240 [Hyphomonadaceae bacterium]